MDTPVTTMLLRNKETRFTPQLKHRDFAYEYLIDYDIIRAYRTVYTEESLDDASCLKSGSRLLRSPLVQRIIDEETCKIIAEKKLDKSLIIDRLQRVYLEAMKDRDYASANSALDKLMKHYGLYDKHQKQRRYSSEELVAIKQKLTAYGIQLDSPNKPIVIQQAKEVEKTPNE